jgi:anti-sigma-K factor RskA
MRNFSRFLRVILLPVAVLAMVAGSSASASASTLSDTPAVVAITTSASAVGISRVKPLSMNF